MKTYIIIHEGIKSEHAYIQELNRFVRDELGDEMPLQINFVSTPTGPEKRKEDGTIDYACRGSGKFSDIQKRYKIEKSHNRNPHIIIWADNDIYKRNDNGNQTLYERALENGMIPKIHFNYFNYEDFLALHFKKDAEYSQWEAAANGANHFTSPLHACNYLPLYETVFPGYQKNEMPFSLTKERLECLFTNNSDTTIRIKSKFADFLKSVLTDYL